MKNYFAMALMLLSFNFFAVAKDQTFSGKNRTKISDIDDVLFLGRPSLKIDHNNLGRAWIEVDVNYDDIDDVYSNTVRVKVAGLKYDVESGEILYKSENDSTHSDSTYTICATVSKQVRRGLFGGRKEVIKILSTGRCVFTARLEKQTELVDDGFDLVKKVQGYLSISVETF